jgi:hypothetical protein
VKKLLIPLGIALAAATSGAWAKAPADATGECKDGTYTTSASKEGACSSHGGVKKWMAKEEKSSSAKEAKSSSAKSSKTAAAASSAEKPANATGECKDGTYTDSASKSGACSGHKGVKTWYGAKESTSSSAAPSTSGAASSKSGTGSSKSSSTSSTATPKSSSASTGGNMAAAGGGSGKVWVNTDSKVYHCEKDALYGKTKQGEYMSESQAKASGARAARGKECA